jgi:FdhD protein
MGEEGLHPVTYIGYHDSEHRRIDGVVPIEERVTLFVNAEPLVSVMCTPVQLKELALGFIYNEGLINRREDVAAIGLCGAGRCVDLWLEYDIDLPKVRTITSGCSGGTTFEDVVSARHHVDSTRRITPERVTHLMDALSGQALLYHHSGGVHTAALSDGERIVCVAEDIGRHNTLDKVAGTCLQRGHTLTDGILLTSGRISSEMVQKAARMQVPIIISRTSPTSLSVQLAQAWGLTLIGYTRLDTFHVYAGGERVVAGE